MRMQLLLFAFLCAIRVHAQPTLSQSVEVLTLEEAWRLSELTNPALRSAQAQVSTAEGQMRDTSGLLWNNPQLVTDLTRRHVYPENAASRSFSGFALGVSQTFEIAGQQGFRRRAAQSDAAAVGEVIEDVRRQVRGEVELAFTGVLALQRRIAVEEEALKVVIDVASAVRKRVQTGQDSRLDGNLADVEAERARNQLTALHEQLLQARARLAALVQLPPATLPEAKGNLQVGPPQYTLASLLASAAARPQLRALALRETAARDRLSLERAAAYPDVTLSLTTGREETIDAPVERPTMLSISVPLPLFRRNAAGIGRAASELSQAQIDRQTLSRDIEAQVRNLWERVESLRDRVKRLSDAVLPRLEENQRLSSIAFRAGEIGILQLLLVNRQFLDARRDYLDAFSQFIEARVALEQTAGLTGSTPQADSHSALIGGDR